MSEETKEMLASWVHGASRWEGAGGFSWLGGVANVGGQGIWGQMLRHTGLNEGCRLGVGRSEIRVSEDDLESGYLVKEL